MTLMRLQLLLLLLAILLLVLLVFTVRELRRQRTIAKSQPNSRRPDFPVAQAEQPVVEIPPQPGARRRQFGAGQGQALDRFKTNATGLYSEVEANLERAFNQYTEGQMLLSAYEVAVNAEFATIERTQSALRARELAQIDPPADLLAQREEISRATDAVQWCRNWVSTMRAKSGSEDS